MWCIQEQWVEKESSDILSRGTGLFIAAVIVTLMAYGFWFSGGFYEKGLFDVWEEDYDICSL